MSTSVAGSPTNVTATAAGRRSGRPSYSAETSLSAVRTWVSVRVIGRLATCRALHRSPEPTTAAAWPRRRATDPIRCRLPRRYTGAPRVGILFEDREDTAD